MPTSAKRRPRLAIDGKYSIPFTSAVMMVKGNVTLRDYTDEGLRDPAVLAMVTYREDPHATLAVGGYSALSLPSVEIRTRSGEVHTCKPTGVPGDPAHPVSDELLQATFRDCVSFSATPVPAANVERAIECIGRLEELDDVAEIVRLLVPGAA